MLAHVEDIGFIVAVALVLIYAVSAVWSAWNDPR